MFGCFNNSLGPRWRRTNTPPKLLRTDDRLGDHLVAQLNQFRQQYKAELPNGRGLNLEADLATYENEKRLLVKLASTGHVTRVLERFGCVLDAYIQVFDKERAEAFTTEWNTHLQEERDDRIRFFRDLMRDEERLTSELGGEQQQVEVLALLKHDLTHHMEHLLPCEIDIMSDMYELIVEKTGIVLGENLPSWFVSPGELLRERSGDFFHGVRVSVVEDVEDRPEEHREEACLKQAAIWDRLHHPNIVRLLGACHVGKRPIFVHEIAMSAAQECSCLESWEPLLGWALALEYLHGYGLGYSTFPDTKLLVRHYLPSKGVLCGLGLVQLKHQAADGPANAEAADDESQEEKHTTVNDVYGFGVAVMNKRIMFGGNMTKLPKSIPFGLEENEWALIQKMCAAAPEDRVNMVYVVHRLQSFFQDSKKIALESTPALSEVEVDEYVIPVQGVKVKAAMADMQSKCDKLPEERAVNARLLRSRLEAAYKAALELGGTHIYTTTLASFGDVLNRFLIFLNLQNTKRVSGDRGDGEKAPRNSGTNTGSKWIKAGLSEVAICCATRTEAQTTFSLHHEIDDVLSHLKSDDSIPSPLDWKNDWIAAQHRQLDVFGAHLGSTATLSSSEAQSEVAMLLQLEIQKGNEVYPPGTTAAIREACAVLEQQGINTMVPPWFIPAYHMKLGTYIDAGSFASVYHGKWVDANVVVKVLQDSAHTPPKKAGEETESVLEVFEREVTIWSMMDHENVIKLYGACHVGERFFVCEGANGGNLRKYLAQIDAKPSDKWRCLYQAALGLRYLHNRGIIHGDLKGNNILVGEVLVETRTDNEGEPVETWKGGKVKLTDFGLSVLENRRRTQNIKEEVGAPRWKAPERLVKNDPGPTVESDVFSFGMCIVEVMSGEFPWGHRLPDVAVKYHVVKKKILPPRPTEGFTNDVHWDLVKRMCRYNPEERISMSAVVDALYTFRFLE